MKYAIILPAYNIDKLLTYSIPESIKICTGHYVTIPIKNKKYIGIVYKLSNSPPDFNVNKIKSIDSKLAIQQAKADFLEFIMWVAKYNMLNVGTVFKAALEQSVTSTDLYEINKQHEIPNLSKAQKKFIEILQSSEPMGIDEIIYTTKMRVNTINSMLENNILIKSQPKAKEAYLVNIQLSETQQIALDNISTAKPNLLYGVTGSGKTEVYLKYACKHMELNSESQILILIPEIGLTSHLLKRFLQYFKQNDITEWHSKLTSSHRKINWCKIINGESRITVGTRSALMLPFKKLSLIIVDEEHDSSYKQGEGILYNARDMALVRSKIENTEIILASATPSLETIYNVYKNKFKQIYLDSRYQKVELPEIKIIDMRKEKKIISSLLRKEIEDRVEKKEQVILFLNKRGYSSISLCKECGYRVKCENCCICLTEHKSIGKLICHYCGYEVEKINKCPECSGQLKRYGMGVEKIAEIAQREFPDLRLEIVSSDNTQLETTITKILNGSVDIIIGTQIIAKGYHFPNLTLVGIIDADIGLEIGELRASEKTFQMLQQISGRAGREKKGSVLIQTYMPENPIMQSIASEDRDLFYSIELENRKNAGMPPFKSLAAVIVSHKINQKALQISKEIGYKIPKIKEIIVLGPSPAPLYKLNSKFRYRFLIIGKKGFEIQEFISLWMRHINTNNIKIEIDPISFL